MLGEPMVINRTTAGLWSLKLLVVYHLGKTILYQIFIASSQYCTMVAVLLLSLIELTKIAMIAYAKVKHNMFKSSLDMTVQVSQSAFLLLFLALCGFLGSKDPVTPIPDSLQVAGMVVVVCSVAFEYVLIFGTVGFGIWGYFQAKKLLRKEQPKSDWYIEWMDAPQASSRPLAPPPIEVSRVSKPTVRRQPSIKPKASTKHPVIFPSVPNQSIPKANDSENPIDSKADQYEPEKSSSFQEQGQTGQEQQGQRERKEQGEAKEPANVVKRATSKRFSSVQRLVGKQLARLSVATNKP